MSHDIKDNPDLNLTDEEYWTPERIAECRRTTPKDSPAWDMIGKPGFRPGGDITDADRARLRESFASVGVTEDTAAS